MRKSILILTICLSLLLVACGQQSTQGSEGAAMGDTVMVKYIGKFANGTVFDTNVESVATSNGINKTGYAPLEIQIGQGQVISGFENALIGMKVGDKKTVNLSPSEAYGERQSSKVLSVNRRQEVPREVSLRKTVTVPVQQLQQLPGNGTVGEVVEYRDISYEITDKNSTHAALKITVDEGDQLQLPQTPWNSTVVEQNETSYVVRQDPANGSVMRTQFGPVRILVDEENLTRVLMVQQGGSLQTQQGTARVINVTEDEVTFDFNHPLAGENLFFEIEVVGIQ